MRISTEILDFFRQRLKKIAPEARLFLFGSRNDNSKKGGDIDILVLTEKRIPSREIRRARIEFFEKFGEQKLDLLNFTFPAESPFKRLAMLEGSEFS